MKEFIHFDLFTRHKFVSDLINRDDSVLDAGGDGKILNLFLGKANKIYSTNLDQGDVISSLLSPPFKDESFDSVCCLDVLEHLPKKSRQRLIDNIVKVSKKQAIFSIPAGTKEHIEMEERALKKLKTSGRRDRWLEEHCKYGLPTKTEIENLFEEYNSKIFYCEDFTLFMKLSKFQKNHLLFKFANFFHNVFLYLLFVNTKFSNKTNRFYIQVIKH